MGFSQEWDTCYREQTQLSVWPWSEIISLVTRHCKSIIRKKAGATILELGCGAGANIPYFRALESNYHAIEGSPEIVKRLHERFPDLKGKIKCGDFTIKEQWDDGSYDLIVDRAAITHNNTESIINTLEHLFKALKPGGIFIGVDWFSTKHSDYISGEIVDDQYTKNNYSAGQFVGVGKVHFSDECHLRDLFKDFKIIFLEEKIIERFEPFDSHKFASWNIVVEKPYA